MENGKPLRPSDWCERLSSTLTSFLVDNRLRYAPGVQPHPQPLSQGERRVDNRLRYAPGVQPCILNGERWLVVARWLETSDPPAYAYVMGFARDNHLRVQLDRRTGERALQRP